MSRRRQANEKQASRAQNGAMFVVLATFAELFVRGNRSKADADQLEAVLRLAAKGRRYVVMELGEALSAEELQAVLSQEVDNVGLDRDQVKYLRDRGVRYVGEVFLLNFGVKAAVKSMGEGIVDHLRSTFRIPEILDVRASWTPPYWDDAFRMTLRRPIDEIVVDTKPAANFTYRGDLWYRPTRLRTLHFRGIHYAGQFLGRDYRVGTLRKLHKQIRGGSGLRAAMMLPPDLELPADAPDVWTAQLESLREEHEAERRRRREQAAQFEAVRQSEFAPILAVLPRLLRAQHSSALREFVHLADLSIRAENALVGLIDEHHSLRSVVAMTPETLRAKTKNFGRKSIKEFDEEVLQEIHPELRLGMDVGEIDELAAKLDREVQLDAVRGRGRHASRQADRRSS